MAVDDLGCYWWHSIELPGGRVTPGDKTLEFLRLEWDDMALPPLEGRSVLDIGAWDGWFSFAAEREGASRVVALDHFVWALDFAHSADYWDYVARCNEAGEPAAAWGPECPWWDPERLLGKRAFDTAHAELDSRVEAIVADFAAYDLDQIGVFDITFFLGVLYHLRDPLGALARLRAVTNDLAVIETAAIELEHEDARPLLELTPGAEVNADPTNWFFPNEAAAHGMLRATGFTSVETVARSFRQDVRPGVTDYRLTLHARP